MSTSFFILDSASRMYWMYLLGSIIFGCVLISAQKKNAIRAFLPLFSPSLWYSRSSWVDAQWFLLNTVLKLTLLAPLLTAQYTVALGFNRLLYENLGEGNFLHWKPWSVTIAFTVIVFLIDDFSRFFVHTLYHRISWLWRFHAIHHSAAALTPLTFYRVHSLELLINSARSVVVTGGVSGVFIYLFENNIHLISILGVNVFIFVFNLLGSNLRHSPVWVSYGFVERLLISPAQHQIHHSQDVGHLDKNMGSTLAIWDYCYGSLLLSKGQKVQRYGVLGHSGEQKLSSQLKGIA